jgi:uncharacterized protein
MKARRLIVTACVAASILVTACTTQPVVAPDELRALEARAQSAADAGDLRAAASVYRQLAGQTTGRASAAYLVEGARLLIDAGDDATAGQWLAEARDNADEELQKDVLVLLARIDVDRGEPQSALDALARIREPIDADLSRDVAAVKGNALFALGRRAEAVEVLVEREIWLDTADQVLANQRAIWDGLRTAPGPRGDAATGDPVVDGWLALEPLARSTGDPDEFRRALIAWRTDYANHPAAGGVLAEILRQQQSARPRPSRIALLLPITGEFASYAIAIRDGFLAAHLADDHRRETRIRVYDTGAEDAAALYLRAQSDGADFIVGPLLRENVDRVMAQAGLVPTLALNFSETDALSPGSFNQFAQLPEDEARAVARRAVADGAQTAVALVAGNAFGDRLLKSFRDEFERLGGQLLQSTTYDPGGQEFGVPIESLLNIADSQQRYRRLRANLGVPVEFEPRRRQDVDMIFLGADSPRAGRLLLPQLRFHDAGDIPTYATHEVFDPSLKTPDNDLNGVIFADAPLLLDPSGTASRFRQELETYWPERAGQRIRYYAMGFDAFELITSVSSPAETYWPVQGLSGELSLEGSGQIHRSALPFAQIRDGRPALLPSAAPVEALDAAARLSAR